jgi:hypothetical protein
MQNRLDERVPESARSAGVIPVAVVADRETMRAALLGLVRK